MKINILDSKGARKFYKKQINQAIKYTEYDINLYKNREREKQFQLALKQGFENWQKKQEVEFMRLNLSDLKFHIDKISQDNEQSKFEILLTIINKHRKEPIETKALETQLELYKKDYGIDLLS